MGITIIYNVGREIKVSPHVAKKEINNLSNNRGHGAQDKNGHLGESKNNANVIMFMKSHKEDSDKIHGDGFPWTGWNQ